MRDSIVVIRHGGFWRLQQFEPPEDTDRSLEAKVIAKNPSLSDYAAFIAKLSPIQLKAFTMKKGSVTKFALKPIQTGFPALQFYSSLDQRMVDRAVGNGISYDQFASSQRQLFFDAAVEGVFLGTAGPGFTEPLWRAYATGDARGLGFLMRKQIVDVAGAAVDGQAMLFGNSLKDASTYTFPLSL